MLSSNTCCHDNTFKFVSISWCFSDAFRLWGCGICNASFLFITVTIIIMLICVDSRHRLHADVLFLHGCDILVNTESIYIYVYNNILQYLSFPLVYNMSILRKYCNVKNTILIWNYILKLESHFLHVVKSSYFNITGQCIKCVETIHTFIYDRILDEAET